MRWSKRQESGGPVKPLAVIVASFGTTNTIRDGEEMKPDRACYLFSEIPGLHRRLVLQR
jgi:hypothetical protein